MARNIVVIGASAGGLEALKELLRGLPRELPASIFVVLHIPSFFESKLPQVLNRSSSMAVIHAANASRFEPGRVYVAPPDHHLRLQGTHIELDKGPRENRQRPAIDALFRSAAWGHGKNVIGVILTGTLDDGTAGLWEIKKRGGLAVVQAPEDALYSSMPLSAIKQVQIDYIVPIESMAELLSSLCTGETKSERSTEGLSPESEL